MMTLLVPRRKIAHRVGSYRWGQPLFVGAHPVGDRRRPIAKSPRNRRYVLLWEPILWATRVRSNASGFRVVAGSIR